MGTLWVNAFRKIIGKRIQGLIVVERGNAPSRQVFIVLDDGTHYELYGDIEGCKDIDRGGLTEIRQHLRGTTVLLDVAAANPPG